MPFPSPASGQSSRGTPARLRIVLSRANFDGFTGKSASRGCRNLLLSGPADTYDGLGRTARLSTGRCSARTAKCSCTTSSLRVGGLADDAFIIPSRMDAFCRGPLRIDHWRVGTEVGENFMETYWFPIVLADGLIFPCAVVESVFVAHLVLPYRAVLLTFAELVNL